MTGLERAVADLRADLTRHEGGLVRVFAEQLEAVLDALEGAPVAEPVVERVLDPTEAYRNKNGWYHVGLPVVSTKRLDAYPLVRIGTEGEIVRHNYNTWYAYGVKFAEYFSPINVGTDEIEVRV